MAKEKFISLNLNQEQPKTESIPPKSKKSGLVSLDIEGHQQAQEDRIAEAEGATVRADRNRKINPLMGEGSFGSQKENTENKEDKEGEEKSPEREGRRLRVVPQGGFSPEETQTNFKMEAQERAQKIFDKIRGFRENMRPRLEGGRVTPAVFTELLKLGLKEAFRPVAERIFDAYNSGDGRVLGAGRKFEASKKEKKSLSRKIWERILLSPEHRALKEAIRSRDEAQLRIRRMLRVNPELRKVYLREVA